MLHLSALARLACYGEPDRATILEKPGGDGLVRSTGVHALQ